MEPAICLSARGMAAIKRWEEPDSWEEKQVICLKSLFLAFSGVQIYVKLE